MVYPLDVFLTGFFYMGNLIYLLWIINEQNLGVVHYYFVFSPSFITLNIILVSGWLFVCNRAVDNILVMPSISRTIVFQLRINDFFMQLNRTFIFRDFSDIETPLIVGHHTDTKGSGEPLLLTAGFTLGLWAV